MLLQWPTEQPAHRDFSKSSRRPVRLCRGLFVTLPEEKAPHSRCCLFSFRDSQSHDQPTKRQQAGVVAVIVPVAHPQSGESRFFECSGADSSAELCNCNLITFHKILKQQPRQFWSGMLLLQNVCNGNTLRGAPSSDEATENQFYSFPKLYSAV